MWSWWLTVTLVIAARSQLVYESPTNGLEENDACHVEGTRIWRCRKEEDCSSSRTVLLSGGKLRTCAWKDAHTHIVCCPPEPSNRITESISEKKCKEFQARLCHREPPKYEGPKYEIVTKKNLLMRTRRQGVGLLSGPSGSQSAHGFDDEGSIGIAAVGGFDANSKEFPHMALVGYGNAGRINWQCGGSLISERFVLSAAHCSDTSYGPARWVRLGDLDISTDSDDAQPQQFEIVERIVHSAYKPPTYYNDIVLFRLDRAAVFDSYVAPTCLYAGRKDLTGVGVATGWGRNETNGPRSKALVKVYLKFIPTEVCRSKTGTNPVSLPWGVDLQTMMCAGEPGKDTCQGDSGGPLVLEVRDSCLTRQVGVTSFGPKACGLTQLTGIYVRVAHFLPWIESVVWPN